MSGRPTVVVPAAPSPRRSAPRPGPVDRLGRRLAALYPQWPSAYAVTQAAPGGPWLPAARLVAAMTSGDHEHLRMSPAVAGARLIGSLGHAALGRVGVAVAVAGQAYSTAPDSLLGRLDGEGLVEAVAVRQPVLAVLPGDPVARAGSPPVVVLPSRAALVAWTAERAFASLTVFVDEVHAATGYGRTPMWNLIGDSVLGPCASVAALAGGSAADGHAVGTALLDALVALGAPITRRGTLCSVAPDGTPTVRRAACCLFYRQAAGTTCDTCPLPRAR